MSPKFVILIINLYLLPFLSFGQVDSSKFKKAQEAFEGFSYQKALKIYASLKNESIDTKRNTALSLWRIGQTEKAEPIFQEVVNTEGHTAEDIYNYASLLRELGKYDLSQEWMKKFAAINPSDKRGKYYVNNPNEHEFLLAENTDYEVYNLKINTEQQEFGTNYYKNQIVFVSSREETKPIRRKWNRNEMPFLDIYTANREEDNELSYPRMFAGGINKKYHEGPLAFTNDGATVIYTCNNYGGESKKGFVRLQLIMAQNENGQWKDQSEFPYNSDEFSIGHPNFSKDGKWLYFASNMPGGYGGVDLYRCSVSADFTFGEPENLGPKVNTEGDEMFPYVHPSNQMLFFASDGRVGLGGMDIYLAQIKANQTFGKVMNLGAPINSAGDDIAFIMDEDQKHGYFSSNRPGGHGSDDIYGFNLSKPYSFGKELRGVAKDKKGNLLGNTRITLFDLTSGDEETVVTDDDGQYSFLLEEEKVYTIRGRKTDYFDGVSGVDTYTQKEYVQLDLVLEKDPGLSLFFQINDQATNQGLNKVNVTIINNVFGTREEYQTNMKGELLIPLFDNKLNDRLTYTILLEKDGYLAKKLPYSETLKVNGKYNVADKIDLNMYKVEVGSDLMQIMELNQFDFSQGNNKITPEIAVELDKIIEFLLLESTLHIDVKSYTDSRGKASNNLAMSAKRANAVVRYLKTGLKSSARINGIGYGETNLLNDCADGVECSEEDHEKNNRIEIILTKL
jgi:outer membrane protein OmpA-like peptidoglycan-associated protein